ncbi:MAG TPA: response regulator transcription factor [Methylococcaceae bacterium]|nr:response regulator transcription factor [Methylococcaceae bacterium]
MIRVLLAEDHDLVRLGLRTLIQAENGLVLAGEAASFAETLALAQRLAPDVILLNLTLSDGPVMERIPQLLGGTGKRKVLVLTGDRDKEVHRLALRMGAMGVFTKDGPAEILPKAIRRVHAGELWADRGTTAALFQDFHRAINPQPASKEMLTHREHQIATLAAQGLPAKKIAGRIHLSDKTVRNQLVIVYSKLNVAGQLELAVKAQELGLL